MLAAYLADLSQRTKWRACGLLRFEHYQLDFPGCGVLLCTVDLSLSKKRNGEKYSSAGGGSCQFLSTL